jgi:tetratricopeptide (TPR) repeat protein
LAQTLHVAREVNAMIDDEALVSYKGKLDEAQQITNLEEEKGLKRKDGAWRGIKFNVLNWKLLAAACIAVFATLSVVFYFNMQPSNDRLFSQYYQRYEADILTRSAEPSDVSDLIKAIQFYDKGNYMEAISLFKNIIKVDATNTVAHFFMGVCLIETKDYPSAIESLNYVINQKDAAFIEHAQWYLALCYVKINQSDRAATILTKIINDKTFYRTMAIDLLKKVK